MKNASGSTMRSNRSTRGALWSSGSIRWMSGQQRKPVAGIDCGRQAQSRRHPARRGAARRVKTPGNTPLLGGWRRIPRFHPEGFFVFWPIFKSFCTNPRLFYKTCFSDMKSNKGVQEPRLRGVGICRTCFSAAVVPVRFFPHGKHGRCRGCRTGCFLAVFPGGG